MDNTYPPESRLQLMGSSLVFAAYLSIYGLVFAVFLLVFGMRAQIHSVTPAVPAEVMELEPERLVSVQRNGRRQFEKHVNRVALRVTTAEGQVVNFELAPLPETFADLRIGQMVRVKFNPQNPLSSILESEFKAGRLAWVVLVFGVATGLTLGGAAVLVIWARRRANHFIYIRDHGHARDALVTAWHRTRPFKRTSHDEWRIAFLWRDEAGAPGKSFWQSVASPADEQDLPAVGQEICVYVAPGNGKLSVWAGDVGNQ